MTKHWPLLTLCTSLILLGSLKFHETSHLKTFFRAQKVFIPQSFKEEAKKLKGSKLEALGVWESLLFGKSKHVKKETMETYKKLGLLHLFTPSGFHLSAVLIPVFYFLRSRKKKLLTLIVLGLSFSFLPGLSALKRMVMIKVQQNIWGQKAGFFLGCLLDLLFGSFQTSPLSFSYSFLFLSFIYGGRKGMGLFIWFYLGQLLITYFQGGVVSPLLLLFSPIMNFSFSLILPFLLLLSFPLTQIQLEIGIFLIESAQHIIRICFQLISSFPFIEVTGLTLLFLLCFMMRRLLLSLIVFFFLSQNLNSNYERTPQWSANEFVPKGRPQRTRYLEAKNVVYFEDGICNLRLIRGHWWESCSPRRRSSRRFN